MFIYFPPRGGTLSDSHSVFLSLTFCSLSLTSLTIVLFFYIIFLSSFVLLSPPSLILA